MTTDRYGCRPVVNPGAERFNIPTTVYDLLKNKPLDTYRTHTQAVKAVKRMNKALREKE